MTILTYIEHSRGSLPKNALATIEAALLAKKTQGYTRIVGVIVGGSDVSTAASEAAQFGLDEVLVVKHNELENYLALTYEKVLKRVIEEVTPRLILALASTRGKDLFPRLAQYLGAGQASDILQFLPDGGFKRPMYAGNVFADVEITTDVKVVTVRGASFPAAAKTPSACSVRELAVDVSGTKGQQFVSFDTVASTRPELSDASVVVSGGRAMKSAENFEKVIFPLADVLGAAVGASRAAVDSGYAPNDWQVGQTGKVVAPSLYIAVGISGAIQHLAGMKDSKVIVAINKDPEAPIFEVADYGLVADLYQAVPELIEEIKKVKS